MQTSSLAARPIRMNPLVGLILAIYHGLALAAFVLPLRLDWVLAGFGVFLLVGLGTTLGLHRKLTHRSFDCPRWLEYALVTAAMLTLQSSPLEWVANHRIHHGHADKERDPHTPRKGFWYSYLGWVVDDLSTDREAYKTYCRDLAQDRYYLWLLRYRLVPHALLLALIVAVWGWQAAPCVLYLPLKLWMHAQYMVNSVCHAGRLGFRSYDSPDESRNVWWVGLWALGEGWHNNHHAHPRSPMLGRGPWQLDVGGLVLRLLVKLGLATLPPAAAAKVPAMDAPASPS
ncbi:acyl-CoA desaturase [Pyxidicoccus caerfyrddinensis]|uniref:acyl-CoA desaturase n=1 Tax=Pyxidicoccus caerfyrddinensis TaxID=2709663 RepID=UPI001F081EF2|nr:acyl-CoA desaturase [Pyxidicoccus caerfyrddinensis]